MVLDAFITVFLFYLQSQLQVPLLWHQSTALSDYMTRYSTQGDNRSQN